MPATFQKSYGVAAYLKFVGKPLVMSMAIDKDDQVFTVALEKFTLKDLITGIVQIVKPGYELSIPVPWSYILEFEIPKFSLLLRAPRAPASKIEFGISFDPGFNDYGLKISKIEVFARSVREVNINMEGSLDIFGLHYDLSDLFGKEGVNLLGAEGLPQPAPKPSLFDLKFIGIGQHLQLKKAASYQHVKEVVDDMLELFNPPAPDTVIPKFSESLRFSNESDWLFGLDVEIMKTVALQAVFNDPVLYGIYLKLSGEKAKVLAGLEFEILYKKVTDDIGVYQIELKLPDAIRSLEFGAVSVTLPVIAIWIYTNGNFKVDFGFPYNNDFSRSFAVQCFPFTGQGGFYFAYLNGATSVTVPQTHLGTFDPVLEFGLGLNIGLGKTFNKGILSAGLTLTFYGILEGALAWFKPYDNKQVDKQLTDFFYRVKGTFGIIGHIYGAVNFAIISAALDIVVYAQISVQIEAGAPVLLAFEAGVSLKLTVKINLGLFKVSIALSFSATISESFTIGHASLTQWNSPLKTRKTFKALKSFGVMQQQPLGLNWDQVFSQGQAATITVNLVPLFSAGKTGAVQSAYGIATLFLENNRGISDAILKERYINAQALQEDSPLEAFDKLCIALFCWIINAANTPGSAAGSFAALLEQEVSATTLSSIQDTINQSADINGGDPIPFSYAQIARFLRELFVMNIIDPNTDHKEELLKNAGASEAANSKDLFLTLFPMIPQLFLTNSSNDTIIDFSSFNSVNKDYLRQVAGLVRQFSPEVNTGNDYLEDLSTLESIATHLFRDYFLLIGKSLLQTASDVMEVYNYKIPVQSQSLADLKTAFGTDVLTLVTGNKTAEGLLQKDQLIIISGTSYSITAQDTFAQLSGLHDYVKTGVAWARELVTLNERVPLFIPMSLIEISGFETPYRVLPGDTLQTIAAKHNLDPEGIAAVIERNLNLPVLASLITIKLPAFSAKIPENATFLSIATEYNIELADIAGSNANNPELLTAGASITIEKVAMLKVIDLLNAVYQKDFFSGAGGNASRFSLHGLRLPEVISEGDPGNKLEGLYALSGQQFTLPYIEAASTFEYTFTLSKSKPGKGNDAPDWIIFNGTAAESLPYSLLPEEQEMVRQFQQTALHPTIKTGPEPMQLYRDQVKTFAFANPIQWDRAGTPSGPAIWNFSRSLNAVLTLSPEIDLKLAVQDRPGEARRITDLPQDSYAYGTFIPLSIRKSGTAGDTGINKYTFEVFGTDATGIELLTALLRDSQQELRPDSVQVLFAPDAAGNEVKALHSFAPEDLLLLLINTNLSTETNPKRMMLAASQPKISNTPVTTFIERVWKSSLVRTGGYYLYLQTNDNTTLPDNIFAANGEAEIYLLISYTYKTNLTRNILYPFMNAVVTQQVINTSQELLFGSWKLDLEKGDHNQLVKEGKLERNALLKPGNIGFKLSRVNPEQVYQQEENKLVATDYSYALEQQYNLLNFSTVGSEQFKAISSLLPLSPQDNDAGAAPGNEDSEPGIWRYTKALPVARLYQPAAKSKTTFPPPAHLSPYLGLAESVDLAFNWQDNYGNSFDTPIPGLSCRILYFDQIIPLSGWPVLNLDYAFEPQAQPGDNFSLNFEFYPGDQYSWNPDSPDKKVLKEMVLQRAHADLEQYTAIYYQVAEPDFQTTFYCSLDPDHIYPGTQAEQAGFKAGLSTYLEAALQWIYGFIADPDAHNQFVKNGGTQQRFSYLYSYSSGIQLRQVKDIFALSVAVNFCRSEANIDPQFILAAPQVFVPGVQAVSCPVKPRLKFATTTKTTQKALAKTDQVYATKSGKVYHLYADCHYLAPTAATDRREEALSKIAALKNTRGTCSHCAQRAAMERDVKGTGNNATEEHSGSVKQAQEDLLMLNAFARHLEQTFSAAKLKVAAAYVSETDSSISGAKEAELWIVRFKDINSKEQGIGFDIRFEEAVCYAPQPLANFLVSLPDVPIYPFKYYLNANAESPEPKSFDNVDTEMWASRFLAALEAVLAPELALPINMIDHLSGSKASEGILAGLLKAKEQLAEAIKWQTIPVLQYEQVTQSGREIAQEKIKQQLLINLSKGYAINAVVQYNTGISSPYPDDDQPIAPNLYGKPYAATAAGAAARENYTFSTGKVPLRKLDTQLTNRENSYLTYTFATQNAGLEANLALPVDYQISHLEFDISKLRKTPATGYSDDLNNYELSKWLTFIIPLNAQNKERKTNTYIPVPIRQYPSLPAFGSQGFIAPDARQPITIKDTRYASFLFDYTLQSYTAQDTYHFEVYFNARQSDWKELQESRALNPKQEALFRELAQFESVREAFSNWFTQELPKVNAAIDPDLLRQIRQTLEAYTKLASGVAQEWLNLYRPALLKMSRKASVEVVKVTFDLKDRDADQTTDSGLFETVMNNWAAMAGETPVEYISIPVPQLNGYTTEQLVNAQQGVAAGVHAEDALIFRYYKINAGKKEYLSFEEGKALKERTICFTRLSVLQVQNGWAGLYVKRNADLSGGQKPLPTAPEFIYTTPVRRFSNPVTPSRKVGTEIPIPAGAPQQRRLMDYLKYLMAELLALPSGKANPVQLKLLVNYTYCLQEIPVQLPLILVPPTIFDQEDVAGTGTPVKTLNQVILDWFDTHKPALKNGVLNFAVTFYSSVDEANTLPLLSLEQITLKVEDITDISSGMA